MKHMYLKVLTSSPLIIALLTIFITAFADAEQENDELKFDISEPGLQEIINYDSDGNEIITRVNLLDKEYKASDGVDFEIVVIDHTQNNLYMRYHLNFIRGTPGGDGAEIRYVSNLQSSGTPSSFFNRLSNSSAILVRENVDTVPAIARMDTDYTPNPFVAPSTVSGTANLTTEIRGSELTVTPTNFPF